MRNRLGIWLGMLLLTVVLGSCGSARVASEGAIDKRLTVKTVIRNHISIRKVMFLSIPELRI